MDKHLRTLNGAIQVVYSAAVSNTERVAASQVIEAAKELAPQEVERIAYALISQNDLIVAHVGWNFLEHIIKFRWLELDAASRLSIRNGCFAQLKSQQMLHHELRCASARCVVAMVEHEWPQNWPELFDHLEEVGSVSPVHAHIPFVVLQFLIENVVTLVTVESFARKKDLNNAIVINLPRIFHIILFTLNECFGKLRDESFSLIRSALDLFGELAEWVPARVLEPQLNDLLTAVCSFLNTPQFSIYEAAAKCLWRIASRKRIKNEESRIVLALFGDVPMRSVLAAASAAASVGADNVEHYRFLKALCNVLSALGIHLADVWIQQPPNFGMYLAAIEAFSVHPSVYLRNEAFTVFASLIGQEKTSDDNVFNECIRRVIASTPALLEKVGYPSRNDCETCRFSQHDYDDDNDFSHDFTQFRDRCMKVIRCACTEKHFKLVINIVEEWMENRCLKDPSSVRDTEWDAMQRFSKLVLSECYNGMLLQSDDYVRLCSLFDGTLSLLANSTSPLEMNNLLSMLSALLVIIDSSPERLVSLLSQLRRLLTDAADDDLDEKSVKRHCIALLLRLVTNFANSIKAQAEVILNFCLSVRDCLSMMQLAACMQVIAALSNLCIDFATQSSFLSSAVLDIVNYFLQVEIQKALLSDMAFLTLFGFTSPAPANNDEASKSNYMLNRKKFRANLSTLEGIMAQSRSVSPPAHPAFGALKPILPALFLLAERLNSLYDPKNVSILHPSYGIASVFDITASERQQLLTFDPCAPSVARNLSDGPGVHARAFIYDITETTQTLIGHIASKAAVQLYSETEVRSWASHLSSCLRFIPDLRLRFWLRRTCLAGDKHVTPICRWSISSILSVDPANLLRGLWRLSAVNKIFQSPLRPFLCSCPEAAYQNVRSMLLMIVEELNSRLENRWEQLAAFERLEDEEPSEEQMLAEHMACILTRECVTLLRDLFGILDSASDKVDETIGCKTHLLKDEEVMEKIVALIFLCLTCRDAAAAIRIIPVCRAVVDSLSERCNEEMAVFMLVRSIQSLQIHGSDEVALTLLLSLVFHIYSTLGGRFPNLSRVLQQVPGCTVEDVERLNRRIALIIHKKDGANEKTKRDMMKNLLRPVIATAVGEQHRRPVHLRPLPPLPKNKSKELAEEDFTALRLIFGDN